jgi:hypothetical protein
VRRDQPGSPVSPDRPTSGSLEDLRQRLDRLPPSHPSSPRYRGGETKPVRLRDLELPIDRLDAPDERSPERLPAASRPEWQRPLARGEVERVGLGVVDERTRRFPERERKIADYLAGEGAAVTARREDHAIRGRQPDADVDGQATEFKGLDPDPKHGTVKQALKRGIGQASHIVVDGRDTGLLESDAQRGLARFLGTPEGRSFTTIRLVGDSFDINWKRDDSHGSEH